MEKVRIGVLGAGFMGRARLECYRLDPRVEVVAISSRSKEKAEALAREFGVKRAFDRWEAIVADAEVDAVDITLPNFLHHPAAMACIEAGKPFMIEKPLARNVAEGEEIVQSAEAHGIVAVYAECLRFAPACVKTKALIDEGALGSLTILRANEIHNGPFHADWFWDAERAGGGALIDMGIHGVFLLEWMMGVPIRRVYAEMDVLKWRDHVRGGAEDTSVAVIRFENGGIAELTNSWAVQGGLDVRLEVFGTDGSVFLDQGRGASGMKVFSRGGYGSDPEVEAALRPHVAPTAGWSFPFADEWGTHGHAQEARHFVDCILGEAAPACTLQEGLRGLYVIEAMYRSAREGRPIEVSASPRAWRMGSAPGA